MLQKNHYHKSIILLHWVMALSIFLMRISGTIMEYATLTKSVKFMVYQYRKSLGALLLISRFIRIFCRIFTHIPPLPKKFSGLGIKLARLGHYLLYFLIFIMVFSGWLIVSTSSSGLPTIVFGLFEFPHIPNLAGERRLHKLAELIHLIAAICLFLAIVGHILAVIKHKIIDKQNLLKRMWFTDK